MQTIVMLAPQDMSDGSMNFFIRYARDRLVAATALFWGASRKKSAIILCLVRPSADIYLPHRRAVENTASALSRRCVGQLSLTMVGKGRKSM